jgi:predicted AAA+ superfamily ATPase
LQYKLIKMELYSEIEKAYNAQKGNLLSADIGVIRTISDMPGKTGHVDIITGIRRCGKSTFMNQLAATQEESAYFNFEDPRIFGFEVEDFSKLIRVIGEGINVYFFDEIQNIKGWEVFIRNLHDQGKKVFITGSNASLLSRELGTRLTGRHLSHELFPFSFREYLHFVKKEASIETFNAFLAYGGFPEYLKYKSIETLQQLFKDIIYRDIAVRHGVRNVKILIDIALHLLSNAGKEYTLNKLKNTYNLGSANSVAEYVSWFEDSYLLFSIPQFSWSIKSKAINPKKVYAIDTGFAKANSLSYTDDTGRLLENAVFIYLRRNGFEINYFKQKGECDFVTFQLKEFAGAYQVCAELNLDNKDREINGLVEALTFFDKQDGTILTLNQEDHFVVSGKQIMAIPVWKWMLT